MAQNELEWAFKLTDKFADPAKKIASNLKQVDELLVKMTQHEKQLAMTMEKDPFKKQQKALELYRDKLKQSSDVLAKNKERTDALGKGSKSGMSGLVSGLSGMAAAGIAAAAAVGAIGLAAAGSAIGTASLKRNTLAAFTVLTGSKEEAKALYAQITRIADVSPFETKDVSGMFRALLGGGFKKDEVEETLKGVFDVGAIIGGDEGKQAAQSIVQQMLQVKSIGKLAYEDLKQISQAAGGLIPMDKVAAQIAQVRKITSVEAMKMISEGKITAAEGQAALLATINQTADKGAGLGSASQEFGTKSLEGTLSTLKSRFAHLLEDVDITPIIKVITAMSDFFNSAAGKKAQKLFTGMFDELFVAFGKLGEGTLISDVFGAIVSVVGTVVDVFKVLWPIVTTFWDAMVAPFSIAKSVFTAVWGVVEKLFGGFAGGSNVLEALVKGLKMAANILGFIIGAIVLVGVALAGFTSLVMAFPAIVGVAFYTALAYVVDFWKWLVEVTGAVSLFEAGVNIVEGLWQGIKTRFDQLLTDWPILIHMIPWQLQLLLGIHSDSRVMKDLGVHIPGGLESGIREGMPSVSSAIDSMAAPPSGSAGGGSAGGGPMSFGDISFSFGSGPADQNEAREFGRTAAHEFKTTIAKLMSGAALETGAG